MKPSLVVTKIWEDDDMIEVTLAVSDGKSLLATEIYVGHDHLEKIVAELKAFKARVHGGIYDIELGSFGPEYASGAARIRLHFHHMARVFVSAIVESEFTEFSVNKVASRGEIYFCSEPGLLDHFIDELQRMSKHQSGVATLLGRL